jgi:hypothetical protein
VPVAAGFGTKAGSGPEPVVSGDCCTLTGVWAWVCASRAARTVEEAGAAPAVTAATPATPTPATTAAVSIA